MHWMLVTVLTETKRAISVLSKPLSPPLSKLIAIPKSWEPPISLLPPAQDAPANSLQSRRAPGKKVSHPSRLFSRKSAGRSESDDMAKPLTVLHHAYQRRTSFLHRLIPEDLSRLCILSVRNPLHRSTLQTNCVLSVCAQVAEVVDCRLTFNACFSTHRFCFFGASALMPTILSLSGRNNEFSVGSWDCVSPQSKL